MTSMYVQEGMVDISGTFDVYVRNMPANRNYLVFGGLEPLVDYLTNFKFTPDQISYLKKAYNLPMPVVDYFKNFRFSGDIWSMPEGSIFFPGEPVIRIKATIIEAQLIERYLLNTVIAYTVFSSKMSRFVNSVKKGVKTGVNFTRAHGPQASLICLRSAKAVGLDITACPIFSMRNKQGGEKFTVTHSFITSFATEEQALRTYAKYSSNGSLWLLDTYDSTNGLKTYIKVAKELKRAGKPYPDTIMFDSGDLAKQTKIARKKLDQSGLKNVKLILVSNLDEYKVKKLYSQGAVGDLVIGGEELTTSPDAPKLEFVSKLAEIIDQGRVIPKMKLSSEKLSYPGRKQVFRRTKNGLYLSDIVALEGEKVEGKKLLRHVIKNGKLIVKLPSIEKISKFHRQELAKFKKNISNIEKKFVYPVKLSQGLQKLTQETIQEIKNSHKIQS